MTATLKPEILTVIIENEGMYVVHTHRQKSVNYCLRARENAWICGQSIRRVKLTRRRCHADLRRNVVVYNALTFRWTRNMNVKYTLATLWINYNAAAGGMTWHKMFWWNCFNWTLSCHNYRVDTMLQKYKFTVRPFTPSLSYNYTTDFKTL